MEIYHKEETDKSEADRQKDRFWIVYTWIMCSDAGSTQYAVVFGVRRPFPEIAENGKTEMKERRGGQGCQHPGRSGAAAGGPGDSVRKDTWILQRFFPADDLPGTIISTPAIY